PEAPGRAQGRRWPWPPSAPSPSTRSRPTRCATSPRSLPGARPNRDNESPDLSWHPPLPFVWSSNDPNLQEGARFQNALGRVYDEDFTWGNAPNCIADLWEECADEP